MDYPDLRTKAALINWKYPFIPQRDAILAGSVLEEIVERDDLVILDNNHHGNQLMMSHPFELSTFSSVHTPTQFKLSSLTTKYAIAPKTPIYNIAEMNDFLDSLKFENGKIYAKSDFRIEKEDERYSPIELGEITVFESIDLKNASKLIDSLKGYVNSDQKIDNKTTIVVFPEIRVGEKTTPDFLPPHRMQLVVYDAHKKKYLSYYEYECLMELDKKEKQRPMYRIQKALHGILSPQ